MAKQAFARAEAPEPVADSPKAAIGEPQMRKSRYGGLMFVGVIVALMVLVIAIDLLRR